MNHRHVIVQCHRPFLVVTNIVHCRSPSSPSSPSLHHLHHLFIVLLHQASVFQDTASQLNEEVELLSKQKARLAAEVETYAMQIRDLVTSSEVQHRIKKEWWCLCDNYREWVVACSDRQHACLFPHDHHSKASETQEIASRALRLQIEKLSSQLKSRDDEVSKEKNRT